MINKTPYLNQPCERCGSKKIISKVRNGQLKNLSGMAKIEYSQIICTNKPCQREFEGKLLEREEKEKEIRFKREEAKAARSKNQLLQ